MKRVYVLQVPCDIFSHSLTYAPLLLFQCLHSLTSNVSGSKVSFVSFGGLTFEWLISLPKRIGAFEEEAADEKADEEAEDEEAAACL